jgi:hypothetical protein
MLTHFDDRPFVLHWFVQQSLGWLHVPPVLMH